MPRRRDALLGAARMIDRLNAMACDRDELMRLTVGRLEVEPNSGATIPGRVRFVIDFRHPDPAILDAMDRDMAKVMDDIAQETSLATEIEALIDAEPVPFDDALTHLAREQAVQMGYAHMDMLSGAGHDAMNIAKRVPTTMIFVPCKDGISHNEAESAEPEDLAAGTNVLLRTLVHRAGRAS
jgi:N-carbamoyl-L-amino-acid hydrolase